MTFDELNEHTDELGISGDTPFRIFFDGVELDIFSFTGQTGDGTVHIHLEEA